MEILFRDESLVAVNKPAGLLVHRSAIDRRETRYAMQIIRDRVGRRVYPVHRLDKATSGILVFALDRASARRMTGLFSEGAVEKRYLAVVRGYTDEFGLVDYALEERPDRMTDANASRDNPARPAVTYYRRLAIAELPFAVGRYPTARYSLLQISPKTGRKHQIRRHMKHICHPIVGDTSYGDGRHNAFFRTHFGCHRLLLCATRLAFTHPGTGEKLRLKAPPDETFRRIVDHLGWTEVLDKDLESGH